MASIRISRVVLPLSVMAFVVNVAKSLLETVQPCIVPVLTDGNVVDAPQSPSSSKAISKPAGPLELSPALLASLII